MNVKNILLYALFGLSPLQLHGMIQPYKTSNAQLSRPGFNNNNSLKRAPETDIFSPSLQKKSRTASPKRSEFDEAYEVNKTNLDYFISLQNDSADDESETIHIDLAPVATSQNTAIQRFPFYLAVEKTIHNINPDELSELLINNGATQLNKEERESLYKSAKEHKGLIKMINNTGMKIVSKTDNEEIKTKFSYDTEYKNIQKITHNLDALKTLPELTFPQTFFTNAPRYRAAHQNTKPDQALLTLIKNEQEEISVCCYSFNLESIAKKLIHKKNKGLIVKVITDYREAKKNKNHNTINLLVNNGIPVLAPQNDDLEMNHHKFTLFKCNLFNKKLVSHGSFNYSDNATQRSWEDMTVSDDPYTVAQFEHQFEDVEAYSRPLFLEGINK